MYILDIFLTENNCSVNYLNDNESNKITITFNQEDIVFNFNKKLNSRKNSKSFLLRYINNYNFNSKGISSKEYLKKEIHL